MAIPTDLTGRQTTAAEISRRMVLQWGEEARAWRDHLLNSEFVTEREATLIDDGVAKQLKRVRKFLRLDDDDTYPY